MTRVVAMLVPPPEMRPAPAQCSACGFTAAPDGRFVICTLPVAHEGDIHYDGWDKEWWSPVLQPATVTA